MQHSSQANIHNLNVLMEANALLTKQLYHIKNEKNMLREQVKTKDVQLKKHVDKIAILMLSFARNTQALQPPKLLHRYLECCENLT